MKEKEKTIYFTVFLIVFALVFIRLVILLYGQPVDTGKADVYITISIWQALLLSLPYAALFGVIADGIAFLVIYIGNKKRQKNEETDSQQKSDIQNATKPRQGLFHTLSQRRKRERK